MIIVVCTDDPTLIGIANVSSNQNPNVFRAVYQVFANQIPQLAADEDLFILAHGALYGDEGGPVIGSQRDDFYVTPSVLAASTRGLFPGEWAANVYIDACDSATDDDKLLSFAQLFLYPMADIYAGVTVSGIVGLSSGQIPLPNDPKWKTIP